MPRLVFPYGSNVFDLCLRVMGSAYPTRHCGAAIAGEYAAPIFPRFPRHAVQAVLTFSAVLVGGLSSGGPNDVTGGSGVAVVEAAPPPSLDLLGASALSFFQRRFFEGLVK
jgi:hypothetical protein